MPPSKKAKVEAAAAATASGTSQVKKGITPLLSVDTKLLPWEQSPPLHNRWHPDVPPVATVEEGEVFRVEMIDWTGGQIKNDDSADDVKHVDLTQVHYLSGPIAIPTANPGDLLKVEFLNMGPLPGDEWGFTGTFHKDNGGGFLTDHYPQATKACWDFEGVYCCSRNIPGVRFPGLIHPGLIGTAPSQELLEMWNEREAALVAEEGTDKEKTLVKHMATRPLACLPNPKGAMLGKLGHCATMMGDSSWDKVAGEAARTVPGRENGGNCDIKNLSRGCTVYFPVFVPGANLSYVPRRANPQDGSRCSPPLCLRLAYACMPPHLIYIYAPSPAFPRAGWVTCTSRRATARSPSAVPSRCRATSSSSAR